MVLDVNEIKRRMRDYFNTVTKDQLLKDLVDSGLEVYSKSEYKIAEFMGTGQKEQKNIASIVGANNIDFFCKLATTGPNIVRATYLCGLENTRSANKETNTNVFQTKTTSASPHDWGQYEYQYGT